MVAEVLFYLSVAVVVILGHNIENLKAALAAEKKKVRLDHLVILEQTPLRLLHREGLPISVL